MDGWDEVVREVSHRSTDVPDTQGAGTGGPAAASSSRGRRVGTAGSRWLRKHLRERGEEALLQAPPPRPRRDPVSEQHLSALGPGASGDKSTSLAVLLNSSSSGVLQSLQVRLSQVQHRLLDFVLACKSKIQGWTPSARPVERRTVASLMLDSDVGIASKRLSYKLAASEQYEGSSRTFDRDRQRVSTCFLHFAQISWHTMLQQLQGRIGSRLVPLCIIKSRRYDETPTRLRIPKPESEDKCSKALGVERTSKGVTAKVFQTKMELGFLFRDKSAAEGQQAYVFFRSYIPCPLQLVDQCTAENVRWIQMEQEQRIEGLQLFSQQFPLKLSVPSTDRHYSNKAAERSLRADDTTWQYHHFFCDVHKVAQVHKSAFDLCAGNISGVLMLSIVMKQGNALSELHSILSTLIEDRLELKYGEPPAEFGVHREAVHNLFLASDDVSVRARRLVLSRLMNGNLQRADIIEFWVPSPDFITRPAAVRLFQNWLRPALLPKAIPTFPRSRWTGADLTLDWIGVLQSHHCLAQPLLQRWLQSASAATPAAGDHRQRERQPDYSVGWGASEPIQPGPERSADRPRPSEARQAAAAGVAVEPGDVPETAENAELDGAEVPQDQWAQYWDDPEKAFEVLSPHVHIKPDSGDIDWAAFNAALKTKLRRWCEDSSMRHVFVVMRLAMQAPLSIMRELLTIAGQDWETKQAVEMAKTGRRSYRVLKAADGAQRANFLAQLDRCFQDYQASLPAEACLRSTRVLFFRLTSRAGASAEQLLFAERKGFPWKLFTALDGTTEKFDDNKCMMDPVSLAITRRYPDLRVPEAQACLHALAALTWNDISQVEATHASTRRITTVKSTQTTTVSFEHVNSLYFAKQISAARELAQQQAGLKSHETRNQKKNRQNKTINKRRLTKKPRSFKRSGGAYRAFFSINGRGSLRRGASATFKDLAPRYHAVKEDPEAFEHYVTVGRAGTLAGRAGYKAFGDGATPRSGNKVSLQMLADNGAQADINKKLSELQHSAEQHQLVCQQELAENTDVLSKLSKDLALALLPEDVISSVLPGHAVQSVQLQSAADLITQDTGFTPTKDNVSRFFFQALSSRVADCM